MSHAATEGWPRWPQFVIVEGGEDRAHGPERLIGTVARIEGVRVNVPLTNPSSTLYAGDPSTPVNAVLREIARLSELITDLCASARMWADCYELQRQRAEKAEAAIRSSGALRQSADAASRASSSNRKANR